MGDLNRTVGNLTASNDQLLDKAKFHEEYQALRDRVIVLEGEVEQGRRSEECLLEQLNELKCQMEHDKEVHRQVRTQARTINCARDVFCEFIVEYLCYSAGCSTW